jgi:hypothetical protein
MPFEHVSDRLVRNVVAQIRQGTGNRVVPPTAILLSHPDNESFQLRIDSRSAGTASAPGSVELLCDQPSVPSQNVSGLATQATRARALRPSRFRAPYGLVPTALHRLTCARSRARRLQVFLPDRMS